MRCTGWLGSSRGHVFTLPRCRRLLLWGRKPRCPCRGAENFRWDCRQKGGRAKCVRMSPESQREAGRPLGLRPSSGGFPPQWARPAGLGREAPSGRRARRHVCLPSSSSCPSHLPSPAPLLPPQTSSSCPALRTALIGKRPESACLPSPRNVKGHPHPGSSSAHTCPMAVTLAPLTMAADP